jgi:hypothetical protein
MLSQLPSRRRMAAAWIVAIIADGLQLPLNMAFATGLLSVPAEIAIVVLDVAAFAMLTALLGFHWRLLPFFAAEAVPGLDLLPTWTASVAWLTWERKGKRLPIFPPETTAIESSTSQPRLPYGTTTKL